MKYSPSSTILFKWIAWIRIRTTISNRTMTWKCKNPFVKHHHIPNKTFSSFSPNLHFPYNTKINATCTMNKSCLNFCNNYKMHPVFLPQMNRTHVDFYQLSLIWCQINRSFCLIGMILACKYNVFKCEKWPVG